MDICNIQQFFCIIIVFACFINFQFNTEVTISLTIENRVRLIAVFMNQVRVFPFFLITISTVCITVRVVCFILIKQGIAATASGVMLFIAICTNSGIFIAIGIISPDSRTTAITDCRVFFQAIRTDDATVPFCIVIIINDIIAALANQNFFLFYCVCFFLVHFKFLHKMKIALPIYLGRALCLG